MKLLRAGREWKACCPFHQEKTPSFTINDDKGFYHCFGCGAHGDAIRFLTEAQGMPFIDAVKELAGKAGMEVPAADPRAQEKAERATGLTDVMAAAQRWFTEQLAGPEGETARAYLKARNIDPALALRFGLGLAPNARNRLKVALKSYGEQALVDTGMLIKPEDRDESYDRFRGRLMIPIRDPRGRVIAFGGRILGDGEPKYLNSPETVLFDKGRTLYNIDRAAPASRTAKRLIVVEGYMDVIALDRAGISEVVAPNGTAVTEAQLERMWRLDPAPILCFDGDSAGQKAALRTALRALPHVGPERNLRFVTLPPGRDPDDLVSSGDSPLLLRLLSSSTQMADFLWRSELAAADVTSAEGRANLKFRLQGHAENITDRNLSEEYSRDFRSRFFDNFGFKKQQIDQLRKLISQTRDISKKGGLNLIHRAVLLGLSRFPDIASANMELVSRIEFQEASFEKWKNVLLDAVVSLPGLDEDTLGTILERSDAGPIEKRNIQKDLAFSFFRRMADKDVARRDLVRVMTTLVAENEIERAIQDANALYQRTLDDQAWTEQNALRRRKTELIDALDEFEAALAA